MSAADLAGFMSRADVQQLKDYVRGPSGQEAGRADSTVLLQVTHSNLQARFMEIRFDRHVRFPPAPPPPCPPGDAAAPGGGRLECLVRIRRRGGVAPSPPLPPAFPPASFLPAAPSIFSILGESRLTESSRSAAVTR